MAGRILKKEDFEGADSGKDTSPPQDEVRDREEVKDEVIPADQRFDQHGKPISEEPEPKEPPRQEERLEPPPKPPDEKKYKYTSMDEYDRAYKEAEKSFQADALKGNQVITFSGELPKVPVLLKMWLIKQLDIPEKTTV
jgi:hypothetical protein